MGWKWSRKSLNFLQALFSNLMSYGILFFKGNKPDITRLLSMLYFIDISNTSTKKTSCFWQPQLYNMSTHCYGTRSSISCHKEAKRLRASELCRNTVKESHNRLGILSRYIKPSEQFGHPKRCCHHAAIVSLHTPPSQAFLSHTSHYLIQFFNVQSGLRSKPVRST